MTLSVSYRSATLPRTPPKNWPDRRLAKFPKNAARSCRLSRRGSAHRDDFTLQSIKIDLGYVCQRLDVVNPDIHVIHCRDHPVSIEASERSTDMDGRETDEIAQILLRHRQMVFSVLALPDRGQSKAQFNQGICDPGFRRPFAEAQHAFGHPRQRGGDCRGLKLTYGWVGCFQF